jgi:hypothetical protein
LPYRQASVSDDDKRTALGTPAHPPCRRHFTETTARPFGSAPTAPDPAFEIEHGNVKNNDPSLIEPIAVNELA